MVLQIYTRFICHVILIGSKQRYFPYYFDLHGHELFTCSVSYKSDYIICEIWDNAYHYNYHQYNSELLLLNVREYAVLLMYLS